MTSTPSLIVAGLSPLKIYPYQKVDLYRVISDNLLRSVLIEFELCDSKTQMFEYGQSIRIREYSGFPETHLNRQSLARTGLFYLEFPAGFI